MSLEASLCAFLAQQIPGAKPEVRNLVQMSGGASRETWSFEAAWTENGEQRNRACVLRRDPRSSLLEAGLTTDRSFEFRTLRALEGLPIPIPRMYWLDAEGKWLERPSLIMELMAGEASPPAFAPGIDAAFRERLSAHFVDILAEIHNLDWKERGLDFLEAPGPGRGAAMAQIGRWREVYNRRRPEAEPIIDAAFGWLEKNAPESDRVTLVHGDFRTGNYLHDEAGNITAMLDWELTHLGDPMEDVGWASMKFWRGGGLVGGLMEEEAFYRLYEARAAVPVDRARVFFYQVLGNVKMAVIAQGAVRAFLDGDGAEPVLALIGFMIPRLCEDIAAQIGIQGDK
ncbi:MAG: phosphotransferase family protein [Deltaproteobacteria bacterium]|nr:phosphotransferase family protein [Deltaproteobacteria bacterium]